MRVPVKNIQGEEVDAVELPADVFGVEVNVGLMHQAYVRQLANARQGTHSTLTRSQVNRSKSKWYRQKGTGRARHGSRNAPIFVGGGVAHGPKPDRNYKKRMPRRMRRQALRSALRALAADGQLVLVDELTWEGEAPSTRRAAEIVRALTGGENALVLIAGPDSAFKKSLRNLPQVRYLHPLYLNLRDLLRFDKVIMPLAALDAIRRWLGRE